LPVLLSSTYRDMVVVVPLLLAAAAAAAAAASILSVFCYLLCFTSKHNNVTRISILSRIRRRV